MPVEAERRGFWHEPDGTPTSKAIAQKEWALAAHDVLVETAGEYHATLTEDDLAARVQVEGGIHTSHAPDTWLGQTLTAVAHVCHRAGEPPLTALVVRARDGRVGEAYDEALRVAEQRPITDPATRERHAAHSRLECYRWAGSAPEDGGVVAGPPAPAARARTPRTAAARTPRKPAASDRPVITCPRCFMALPATGICDTCD